MKYNLLQKGYDKTCDAFTDGKINLSLFQKLESLFIKNSYLFTICLN